MGPLAVLEALELPIGGLVVLLLVVALRLSILVGQFLRFPQHRDRLIRVVEGAETETAGGDRVLVRRIKGNLIGIKYRYYRTPLEVGEWKSCTSARNGVMAHKRGVTR